MIRTLSRRLGKNNFLKINDTQKPIVRRVELSDNNTLDTKLTFEPRFYILQDSRRLQTFSVPQEEEIKLIDKQIFNEAALRILIRIEAGFQTIFNSEQNQITRQKIKSITKNDLYSLQISTDKGSFQFQAVADLSTLFYTSPFTGVYKYLYSVEDQKFINNKDKHLLEQNLARQVVDKLYFVIEL